MPRIDSELAPSLSSLDEDLLAAIDAAPLPELLAGPHDPGLSRLLTGLGQASPLGTVPVNRHGPCRSGLWLLAGELEQSHSISQGIDSAEGSFWHAIMHRREGDFGNSKYWFRRVGPHPVLEQLRIRVDDYHDPFRFVDRCSDAVGSNGDEYEACRHTQWLEWQLLMAHCICG